MQHTRQSWLPAAHGADWFRLNRHDDPEPSDPPAPEPTAEPEDPEPDPDGVDSLGDKGKQALDRMKAEKAEAKRAAAAEKKRADELARKVSEFEDRDKTELDKAASKVEKLAEQVKRATARAVKAEVKALAAGGFADPTDADLLGDLSRYVDDDGVIDTDSIETDLADLLDRKPHLRRATAGADPAKKTPRPDPSQGPRPPTPSADFRTADRTEVDAELAKIGFRRRS